MKTKTPLKAAAPDRFGELLAKLKRLPRDVPKDVEAYTDRLAQLVPIQIAAVKAYAAYVRAGTMPTMADLPQEGKEDARLWMAISERAYELSPATTIHPGHVGIWDPNQGAYLNSIDAWPKWIEQAELLITFLRGRIREPKPVDTSDTFDAAAKYITDHPGQKQDTIADAIGTSSGNFRSHVWPKLKRRGFHILPGKGAFPPPM